MVYITFDEIVPEVCAHVEGHGATLGITVSQAYTTARQAAPYGICLHESTRAFAPRRAKVLFGTHYRWWKQRTDGGLLIDSLKTAFVEYHRWCQDHSASLLYEKDRIEAHDELVKDYFTG